MKERKLLFQNPVTLLFLGAAPALAASVDVRAAIGMSIAVMAVLRLLPEGAEPVAAEIPGLTSCVVNAWTAETEEGSLYVFHMLPYGYANEVMDLYLVLDESGAITALRTKELILHSEYFSDYTLDEASYKEGLMGLTADSYTGEQTLIAGATMSSDAMESAVRAAFEAFWLLTENRG